MRVAGRQLSGPAGVKTGKSADGLSVRGLLHCERLFFGGLRQLPPAIFSSSPMADVVIAGHSHNLWGSPPSSHGGGYFNAVGCRRRGPGSVTGWDACLELILELQGASGTSAAKPNIQKYIPHCQSHGNVPNTFEAALVGKIVTTCSCPVQGDSSG